MFSLTPAAAAQILQAAQAQNDAPNLRIAAKQDDSDSRQIVYGMGFDEQRDGDWVLESSGVRVLISPHSQTLLKGATLDFVERLPGEFQFVFANPNAPEPSAASTPSTPSGKSCGGGH